MQGWKVNLNTGASVALALTLVAAAVGGPWLAARRGPSSDSPPDPAAEQYPYHSSAFDSFVRDSYAGSGDLETPGFYAWMEESYRRSTRRLPGRESLTLVETLSAERQDLETITEPAGKTARVLDRCARLHGMVKSVIPRFSLDRGFEFRNVVRYGERQCFLQSVLISALLQEMGVDAGVAMVYRNLRGNESNNGHAVCLVKLPDGTDTVVDASEPEPFARHQGLFVRGSDYEYVLPGFRGTTAIITGYQLAGTHARVAPDQVRTLDRTFLRSQFYFYRGERAPGGLLSGKPTPEGLEASAQALRESIRSCRDNPLAVYSLGRVYLKQGKRNLAHTLFDEACRRYSADGWLPQGPRNLLALSR
jgi:hypothetical protein